jgi:hypothetical protein
MAAFTICEFPSPLPCGVQREPGGDRAGSGRQRARDAGAEIASQVAASGASAPNLIRCLLDECAVSGSVRKDIPLLHSAGYATYSQSVNFGHHPTYSTPKRFGSRSNFLSDHHLG